MPHLTKIKDLKKDCQRRIDDPVFAIVSSRFSCFKANLLLGVTGMRGFTCLTGPYDNTTRQILAKMSALCLAISSNSRQGWALITRSGQ